MTPTIPPTFPATWPGTDRYDKPGDIPLGLLATPPVDPSERLVGEFLEDDGSNGDDVTHDNQLRAVWAAQALLSYAERPYEGKALLTEPVEQAVGDLLSDLRHLCDAFGLDFVDLASREGHYEAELVGRF